MQIVIALTALWSQDTQSFSNFTYSASDQNRDETKIHNLFFGVCSLHVYGIHFAKMNATWKCQNMEWRDCRSEKKDGEYKGEWTVRKSSFHQWWKTSNLKTICVSFCKAVQMNKMCFFFFNFSEDISIAVLLV